MLKNSQDLKIHVSIVDYNKPSQVIENISYLAKQSCWQYISVSVIDNSLNSKNRNILYEGLKLYSNVKLYVSFKNIGYTMATNVSLDLKSDYLVVINPDILIKDEKLIDDCISYLKSNPDVGLVGVKHIDEQGECEFIARSFPSLYKQVKKRILRKVYDQNIDDDKNNKNYPIVVDWVQSSFWVVPTNIWFKVGGLDPRFFLFMNEPDISKRLLNMGYKTVYLGDKVVFTDGIRCSAGGILSLFTSKPLRIHVIDALKYYCKWLIALFRHNS